MNRPLFMTKTLVLITASVASLCALAETPVSCENEIAETNKFLVQQGAAPINNVSDLINTLHSLNVKKKLPEKYISLGTAQKLGWSGNDNDTLWGIKSTNGKWIGGDSFRNQQLPASVSWLSADIDVERGYRGYKRLIYSNSEQQRYLTTDNSHHFVELTPCQ
ncbi:ribonuclease [Scandinavium sp. H11S7]|uniref:Ribonuclease n=1 Tax=Scandinavium hiltneri TaxID=2926519 RepID=A0ABT2DXJ5_9ENTR|nr:ribonuclease domain-containing protein [Scandinavium hiltneri]MCS2160354.1 ribonuclease [Scandinavium hiltneri]